LPALVDGGADDLLDDPLAHKFALLDQRIAQAVASDDDRPLFVSSPRAGVFCCTKMQVSAQNHELSALGTPLLQTIRTVSAAARNDSVIKVCESFLDLRSSVPTHVKADYGVALLAEMGRRNEPCG